MTSLVLSSRNTLGVLLLALALVPLFGCPGKSSRASGDQEADTPRAIHAATVQLVQDGKADGRVNYKRAFEGFKSACDMGAEISEPHVEACYNAGVAASRLDRANTATLYYKMALKADPAFSEAVRNLTVALLADGKPVEALPIYEEYLAAHPKDWDMINNYAGALSEANRHEEGVAAIQKLLFENPKDTRAYKTLARIYFLAGQYRMSQMASANALKLAPDDADIHNNIGITFLKEDKEAEAVVAFKEALKLDPDNLEANMNLGLIAVASADYELAAECFQKVLKDYPGHTESRIGMGIAYRGILELDTAVAQYDSILANAPCQETALLNKGIVQHLFLKKYTEAKKTYSALEKCNPAEATVAQWVEQVDDDIAEEQRLEAELAEMERQLAELEVKAKAKAQMLLAEIDRAQKVFVKYKDIKQDPSWADEVQVQIEATNYAIESEDFFFMEEQAQYLDEFMVAYYQYALVDEEGKPIADAEEWTSRSAIEIPEPAPEETTATTEGAAAEGAVAEDANSNGEANPEPATEGGEAGTAESGNISE